MTGNVEASDQERTVLRLEPQPDSPSLQDPALERLPSAISAPIPTSATRMFHGGSDNALNNSTANLANRDVVSVGSMHVHIHEASRAGQEPSSLPQLLRQPLSILSYIRSTFAALPTRKAVTVLDSPQDGASSTGTPASSSAATPDLTIAHPPDPNILGAEGENTQDAEETPLQATEGIETEAGSFEIALLDDLDMDLRHQPEAWYRSSGGLSFNRIYIKKIYPNGYGYPCPNPSPEGLPVQIGDIGELTSTGFTAIANLADCRLPSLQSELASLALSDTWHEEGYFLEGQSIMGGVSVDKIQWLPESETIKDIKYHCHAPQGAILAVTSPAQLETLTRDRNRRLRAWLCKYGMDLIQSIDPGRIEPLYIVTGKVTSSSWATATYSEPMTATGDALVLTRFLRGLPSYRWTEPGNARNESKYSRSINPEGERASDQCLFLRGFLLTPAANETSHKPRRTLKASNSAPGTSETHPKADTTGGASGEGSPQSTHSSRASSQTGASRMGGRARGMEQDDLLIEEVPSLSSVDFYPSHRINRRLLELTDADLAITHDDDWRLRLEGLHHPSLLGVRESIPASVSGSPELNAGDIHSLKHPHYGDQTSSMGKQDEGQAGPAQNLSEVESIGSTNFSTTDYISGFSGEWEPAPSRELAESQIEYSDVSHSLLAFSSGSGTQETTGDTAAQEGGQGQDRPVMTAGHVLQVDGTHPPGPGAGHH
ncbi:hypothetical protein BKA70DRAFT_1449092 [Coprinopsis sp. MPI-PUGE-AT-0042]|nr:hypothetical protein BKA70DRAFT_1449092 [Coprinopsis sp. MPI-PUGE-AT-0042]